jgi:hypothetical protein
MESEDLPPAVTLRERIAASVPQSSRSTIGSTLVVLVVIFFLVAISQPQATPYREIVDSVFHNCIAMAVSAIALWLARRETFGPLPPVLRFAAGLLLPIILIVTALSLLISPEFWAMLRPFGIVEKEVRRPAITATIGVGLVGCGLLMLRAFLRWMWGVSRRYEHSGFAVGFGPLYFFFRRRRTS